MIMVDFVEKEVGQMVFGCRRSNFIFGMIRRLRKNRLGNDRKSATEKKNMRQTVHV